MIHPPRVRTCQNEIGPRRVRSGRGAGNRIEIRKGVRAGKERCRRSASIRTEGRKLGPVPALERF